MRTSLQALRELEIGPREVAAIGLRILKVRMPWPLEPEAVRHFSQGLDEVLVVEERREIIENQIKQQLFNWRPDVRPRIVGKFDEHDKPYLSLSAALTVGAVARAIAGRMLKLDLDPALHERIADQARLPRRARPDQPHPCGAAAAHAVLLFRLSAQYVDPRAGRQPRDGGHRLPLHGHLDGSQYRNLHADGRRRRAMDGDLALHDEKHIFVNLGDGTYFHSGILAIRQSVAAKVNVTYKLLYNDAVAMTGGQQIDGYMTPQLMTRQLYRRRRRADLSAFGQSGCLRARLIWRRA